MFTSPKGSDDIYSVSDQGLADTFKFIEEIGFGNWGSVWLCERRNSAPGEHCSIEDDDAQDKRVAVKIVHRNKTPTTSARVRSLAFRWNEMKIVRTLRHDSHPSIVPFYSFVITPSYALISMKYLPRLIPVEVAESKARDWCHSLLSGMDFLHKRGIVHNDIKPANILLSSAVPPVPVLVDFGFAEKYDLGSKRAFISNLAYGTPEYLSPERARGLIHDTRKSDIWSLGITFFEILVGRTPFEKYEGETFATKEELEHYWTRTMKGKWLGEWNISRPFEKLLKKMISPNADLRCTARQAFDDVYFADVGFDGGDVSIIASEELGEMSLAMDVSLPWLSPGSERENRSLRKRFGVTSARNKRSNKAVPALKSKFSTFGRRKNGETSDDSVLFEHAQNLRTPERKENASVIRNSTAFRKPVPPYVSDKDGTAVSPVPDVQPMSRRRALGDITNRPSSRTVDGAAPKMGMPDKPTVIPTTERELPAVPESPNIKSTVDSVQRITSQLGLGLRKSARKTKGKHRRAISSIDSFRDEQEAPMPGTVHYRRQRESWKGFSPMQNTSQSSLPAVQQAARNVQMATENRLDRMTIWIRSVEETVKDARRDFESGHASKIPPLPPCPGAVQKDRAKRKILTADKIFGGSILHQLTPSESFEDPMERSGNELKSDDSRILHSLACDQEERSDSSRLCISPDTDFERVLLDTSHVKKVGLGFQSHILGPVGIQAELGQATRKSTNFFTLRRRKSAANCVEPNEMGVLPPQHQHPPITGGDVESEARTFSLMQKAFRVMSRRKSRVL